MQKLMETGVNGLVNAVNNLAMSDRRFAEELVFKHGIREINPESLKPLTKDMFQENGKLSKKGQNHLRALFIIHDLPKNAGWDELLAAVRKGVKFELPKIDQNILEKLKFPRPEVKIGPRRVKPATLSDVPQKLPFSKYGFKRQTEGSLPWHPLPPGPNRVLHTGRVVFVDSKYSMPRHEYIDSIPIQRFHQKSIDTTAGQIIPPWRRGQDMSVADLLKALKQFRLDDTKKINK